MLGPESDEALARKLAHSERDRADHAMDLGTESKSPAKSKPASKSRSKPAARMDIDSANGASRLSGLALRQLLAVTPAVHSAPLSRKVNVTLSPSFVLVDPVSSNNSNNTGASSSSHSHEHNSNSGPAARTAGRVWTPVAGAPTLPDQTPRPTADANAAVPPPAKRTRKSASATFLAEARADHLADGDDHEALPVDMQPLSAPSRPVRLRSASYA